MIGLELVLASQFLLHMAAAEMTCPVQKNARIDVRWRSEPIKYDNSETTGELNATQIDSDNPYGVHVAVDVGGLMSGKMEYSSKVQVSGLRYPTAHVTCLWIDRVMIDVVIDPTIKIAAEHPKGTCEYDAILGHEYKHVAIDRQVVQAYLGRIRAAATSAVQKVGVVGPKPDDRSAEFKTKMADYVNAAVKKVVDAMYAERTARQKALDNKGEYERVSNMCP